MNEEREIEDGDGGRRGRGKWRHGEFGQNIDTYPGAVPSSQKLE